MSKKETDDTTSESSQEQDGSDAPEETAQSRSPLNDEEAVSEKVQQLLSEHGIDASSLDAMGHQILDELATLQKEKPLVLLLGAFAVGCIVGRALK